MSGPRSRIMVVGFVLASAATASTGAQICEWATYGPGCDGLWTQSAIGIGATHTQAEGLFVKTLAGTAIEALYAPIASSVPDAAIRGHTNASPGGSSSEYYGIAGSYSGLKGAGVYGRVTADSASVAGVLGLSEAQQEHGAGVRGIGRGRVGRGVEGHAPSMSGHTIGVFGRVASSNNLAIGVYGQGGGRGVYGVSGARESAGIGVAGRTYGENGRGVYGESLANSGNSVGVFGGATSPTGFGVYGTSPGHAIFGYSSSGSSAESSGVFGLNDSASGHSPGVRGESASNTGRGVLGIASAVGGSGVGVYGETMSVRGSGVHGVGPGTGVLGYSTSTTGGAGILGMNEQARGLSYGVRGVVGSPEGFAGHFEGRGHFSAAVGIGTESPGYLLHVNGDAGKPGGGSWSNASDLRLKTNIEPLANSLDRLLALRGVSFEYRDPERINELEGERIGMIAQEVEAVFPDWVDEGADGFKRVTYRGFEAIIVEAMREMRAESLGRLATLEAENQALRERLARLESLVERLASDE
ncbi:MAG: tail fiber domain-containing protein [Phycisphaerales bacterium]